MTERVDLREFIGGFVAEAEELVATSHALLVAIEQGNKQGAVRPKSVRDLFRALHTIKGLAGMVGVEHIVDVAHALETLVRSADRSGGHLGARAVDVCSQALQLIGENVRAVAEQRQPARAPEALLAAIAGADEASGHAVPAFSIAPEWDGRLTPGERQQAFQAALAGIKLRAFSFVPSEETSTRGVTIAVVRVRVAELAEIIKVAPRALIGERKGVAFDFLVASDALVASLAEAGECAAESISELAIPIPAEAREPEPPASDADRPLALGRSVVRVELSRLDELQEQLSALIVSRFRLEREIANLADRGVDLRPLREVAAMQARQLRDLRRAIVRVRMIRVAEILEPLALLVRSLTRPDEREVRLVIEARDAEVDKAVADRLLPALVHLVRNAIDHAIEPIDERLSANKERAGTIRVSCSEPDGSRLQLLVADDGRGIDRDAVARRAKRAIASDEELLEVLATPGFSTRRAATEISGRGFGMDIVRRITVSELGGELGLSTTPGAGSTFSLRVPLTIAVIDVFAFECGHTAFVVPALGIEEIFELTREHEVQPPGASRTITLVERRGRALPVVSLGVLLAVDDGAGARKAIVTRHNGELVAFAIDRMRGRHEVVVRPLTDPLVRVRGVAGATDLGDGRPTLVLDLNELSGAIAASEGRA